MKFLILATFFCCCYLELVLAGTDGPSCLKSLFGRGHVINLKDGMEKLNEYLVENVQGADLDTNLAAVAKLGSTGTQSSSPVDPSLAEVIKQFSTINKDNLCNEQTINTVYTLNHELDITLPLTESTTIPQKRINSVVYQLREKVSECHDTFLEIVETKNKQMDPVQFGRVKTFVGDAYGKYLENQKSPSSRVFYAPELILFDSYTMDMEHAKILYEEMIKLSKEEGDPLSKLVDEKAGRYQKSGFKNLFNKYFVDSCEHHNKFLSPQLFAHIFEGKFSADSMSRPEDMAYYMSFVRYRTCRRLLDTINKEKRDDEWFTILRKIRSVAES